MRQVQSSQVTPNVQRTLTVCAGGTRIALYSLLQPGVLRALLFNSFTAISFRAGTWADLLLHAQ
jgi:hypothetical protein